MNCFEKEVATLTSQLRFHRTIGVIGSILTLGILRNRQNIDRLHQLLCDATSNSSRYSELCAAADSLSTESSVIVIKGHRVSAHTFTDIPVISAQDYGVDWDTLRITVLERDSYECCESDGYCRGALQVHHQIPLSKGGTNDLDNLVTLCKYHHTLKHPHMQRS